MDFLLKFGGAELYLQTESADRADVVAVIGPAATARLAAAARALPRRVPTAKNYLARRLCASGLTKRQIARKLHVSDVTVRRYLDPDAPRRQPPRQPDLFGEQD
ncbi:helix-turn-helix domain-containing protein [Oceaniglobus trochenteri]|uniref:helix-turn-helix domain-containing protein n=1 Tax=Oceaniglobus trochenteri TaxID=2763260 RepID=UPI001CFFF4FA|nr:helix-turn-helix domain-containing protein [Oceaniglobus trochenteri]